MRITSCKYGVWGALQTKSIIQAHSDLSSLQVPKHRVQHRVTSVNIHARAQSSCQRQTRSHLFSVYSSITAVQISPSNNTHS